MPTSEAVFLTVAAAIASVAALVWFVRIRTSTDRSDLGSVSHHWVAIHRVESGNAVNR
jgi:hypothetical protein